MKRLIIELELTEENNLKPKMFQNLIVVPSKGGYSFYYSENGEMKQLWVKNISIKEVAELDSQAQLLLENKMSKRETSQSDQNH